MARKEELIPQTIVRNLSVPDKLIERRKIGASEIEQLVKECFKQGQRQKIQDIINVLQKDFVESTSSNARKGGLISLAAIALGLGEDANAFFSSIIPAIVVCFNDPDLKVRYYAVESMYNICKVSQGQCLPYFREIFDGLSKMSGDPDKAVRDGAKLLDNEIKDIVTKDHMIDVEKFIPLLKERVLVNNTETRKFLVSWIMVLHSIPDIDLIAHLPQFLDGLFKMLSDKSDDMRDITSNCLNELLDSIKKTSKNWEGYKAKVTENIKSEPLSDETELSLITPPKIQFRSLVKILLKHAEGNVESICPTALHWLNELIFIGKEAILPDGPSLLSVVLRQKSNQNRYIEGQARRVNSSLQHFVKYTQAQFDIKDWISILSSLLINQPIQTKESVLRWICNFHIKGYLTSIDNESELNKALLSVLVDPSEEVVRQALEVLALLSPTDEQLFKLMTNLVEVFRTNKNNTRAALIIRQLCLQVQPEKIYRTISTILEPEEDTQFAWWMIQILNIILLSASELSSVRDSLKNLSSDSSKDLFILLYRSWCHNEVAVFCLCLLSQVYEHATNLVLKFSEFEVTVDTLTEIDKLVNFIESPIFMNLRIQLLEPEKYPFLFKSLYGLLMLLPQSPAFHTLRNRLNSTTSMGEILLIQQRKSVAPIPDINWDQLLNHYVQVRKKHHDHIIKIRLENEKKTKKETNKHTITQN